MGFLFWILTEAYIFYLDFLIAVGANWFNSHNKTELHSHSNTWSTEQDYPFGKIESYAIVPFESSFYIFGGRTESYTAATNHAEIVRFSTITKDWKLSGKLNKPRHEHGVFGHEGEFLVVGGLKHEYGKPKIEKCTLNGDALNCAYVEPENNNKVPIVYYPDMIRVPSDYCLK